MVVGEDVAEGTEAAPLKTAPRARSSPPPASWKRHRRCNRMHSAEDGPCEYKEPERPEAAGAPQATDAPQTGAAPQAADSPQPAGAPQAAIAPQAASAPQAVAREERQVGDLFARRPAKRRRAVATARTKGLWKLATLTVSLFALSASQGQHSDALDMQHLMPPSSTVIFPHGAGTVKATFHSNPAAPTSVGPRLLGSYTLEADDVRGAGAAYCDGLAPVPLVSCANAAECRSGAGAPAVVGPRPHIAVAPSLLAPSGFVVQLLDTRIADGFSGWYEPAAGDMEDGMPVYQRMERGVRVAKLASADGRWWIKSSSGMGSSYVSDAHRGRGPTEVTWQPTLDAGFADKLTLGPPPGVAAGAPGFRGLPDLILHATTACVAGPFFDRER